MTTQVSLEAMYSTAYVENYIDCVENLPDDLQRILSRLRELDCTYRAYLRDVENQSFNTDISPKRAQRLQKLLINAQEVGDEKLQLVQQLQDLIDYRTRKLEDDYSNLDFGPSKEDPPPEEPAPPVPTTPAVTNPVNNAKRARRTRQETEPEVEPPPNVTPQPVAAKSTTKNKKKKQRKQQTKIMKEEEVPVKEDEVQIDPDEPTYCLCDQISFGEMILCDNDLCPIEWFHFSCVALTTKPKGKWFCPKCRGDRPNVMKPKAVFLKELERYNKEKEEKT